MANELNISYPVASSTIYAVIRRSSDAYVWNGTAFAAWANGSIASYDIALTDKGGDWYAADFPSDIAAGRYRISYYLQAGGSPAITDTLLGTTEKVWSGAALEDPVEGSYAVTLAEACSHLHINEGDDDTYVNSLIVAAHRKCEQMINRRLLTTTETEYFERFPSEFRLQYAPVTSVTSITYYDSSNASQTVSASDYEVDTHNEPVRVRPAYGESWPSTYTRYDAVRVIYVCGYGANTDVPKDIKQAILLMIGHWYVHRENVSEATMDAVPQAAEWLLNNYRVWWT